MQPLSGFSLLALSWDVKSIDSCEAAGLDLLKARSPDSYPPTNVQITENSIPSQARVRNASCGAKATNARKAEEE